MLTNDFEQLVLLLPKYDRDSLIDHTVNRIKEALNKVDNASANNDYTAALEYELREYVNSKPLGKSKIDYHELAVRLNSVVKAKQNCV